MRVYFKAVFIIIILVFISSIGFGAIFGYGGGGGGGDDDPPPIEPPIDCYVFNDIEYCGGLIFPLILTATTSDFCGGLIHLDWEGPNTHIANSEGFSHLDVVYYVYKNDILILQTKGTSADVIGSSLDIFTVEGTAVFTPMSDPASAVPSLPCPFQVPTLSAITSYSCGETINLSWLSIIDAIRYKVYKNNDLVITTTSTSLDIKATSTDIFSVKAVFSFGDSLESNLVSAFPSPDCNCQGSIPSGNFEICPGTNIDKGGIWRLVTNCPNSIPFGNCQYYNTEDEDAGDTDDDDTDNGAGIIDSIIDIFPNLTTNISTTTAEILLGLKYIIEDGPGSVVSKIITTTGVVSGAVASSAFALNVDFFSLPFKLWGLLLSVFGLKKRNRPWGTVYDSVTKQPIDPAYVILKNLQTNEELMSITDLDGRYGFLVSPGNYVLSANKTNYIFPSKKIANKTADVLYDNLYFGEELKLDEKNSLINKNIPLDPIKFDWNEFVKGKKKLMKFYSRREKIIKIMTDWMFRIGFLVSTVSLFLVPAPYNLIIFILYIILVFFKKFGPKPKALGSLIEGDNSPLSFAIVRVIDSDLNVEITNKVADKMGKYYCLVPKGRYYIKIEKKNDDESYSLVFTSEIINADNGIINSNFII